MAARRTRRASGRAPRSLTAGDPHPGRGGPAGAPGALAPPSETRSVRRWPTIIGLNHSAPRA
jgi:hypothetical protein